MKSRPLFAALAAMFLVALGGCQMASTVGESETTSTAKGGVAFRLSTQNVNTLHAQSLDLRYKISGAGMDTLAGSAQIDTAPMFIPNVPAGQRVVELFAVNLWGVETWYGRDSLYVQPGQYAYAHIVLHRLGQGPTGTVVLDVSLDDSMEIGGIDSTRPPVDTVWTTRTYHSFYPMSYTTCGPTDWASNGDSLFVRCTRVIGLPIASDTTWSDTTVDYPVSDTARWCRMVDTTSDSGGEMTHASFQCMRLHYQPYTGPVDTLWRDTTATTSACYPLSPREMLCYRPRPDSAGSVPALRKTPR